MTAADENGSFAGKVAFVTGGVPLLPRASRSSRNQSSITSTYGSSRDPRFGGGFLAFGHADASAAATVR